MTTSSRRGPFEPDVEAVLALMRDRAMPSFQELGVEGARAAYRAGKDTSQLAPIPLAEVQDITLGLEAPIAARVYRPASTIDNKAARAILFFHGGGWVIGDLITHDGICRALAEAARRTLIAIDYRLAPEFPLPAAYDDAEAAFRAVVSQAEELRIDRDDIAVAGDSAGGALAASLAVATAEKRHRPVAAALFYPVLDLRGGTDSYREVTGVPLTGPTMAWFLGLCLPDLRDATDPRYSPLLAPSLAGFPPTFLTSAGHDPLCDEAFSFAERLTALNIDMVHRHLPGQIHGYLTLGRLLGEAMRSIEAAGAFLSRSSQ